MAKNRFWLTRWTTWEYLPWWLANGPVYAFYLWFALRARHLFFFSNVNPAIPLGGAAGESKNDILQILPPEILPKAAFLPAGIPVEQAMERLALAGLEFPVIIKPDVGERGFLVKKVEHRDELQAHLARFPVDFIAQEFLTLPMEFSVLFHRLPDTGKFAVTSVCRKEFLGVTGDGRSTIRELMAAQVRAAFQLERFEAQQTELLEHVPLAGERVLLEPIGNHARGTKFLNANALIGPELSAAFDRICSKIDGVLYGRFDLKCASEEALRRGEIKVMELNGVLGEPAHIYDPSFGMWRAYRDLYRHWRILYRISQTQKRIGIRPTGHREAWQLVRNYFRYKEGLNG